MKNNISGLVLVSILFGCIRHQRFKAFQAAKMLGANTDLRYMQSLLGHSITPIIEICTQVATTVSSQLRRPPRRFIMLILVLKIDNGGLRHSFEQMTKGCPKVEIRGRFLFTSNFIPVISG